jgi:DNA (cytosine-5)-methyltransferase 1
VNGVALFAGIGGLELGLRLAIPGYRTVCYVERDAYAAATLVARMEEKVMDPAPIWDDVSTFDGRPWRGRVDLISGGFPCQDISQAGRGEGIGGARSGLWGQFARLVDEMGPELVFVENVAALASRGLDRVLGDLASLGFDAEWDCFSAAGVGAPHLRRRLFILARRIPDPIGDALRIESERGEGAAQASDGGHSEPRDLGEPLAHRGSERLEGLKSAGPAVRATRRSGSASLGDSDGGGLEIERVAQHSDEWSASWDQPHRPDPHRGLRWPAGPGDTDGWREWIAQGGPQPAVRRGVDGDAEGLEYRADRLRCLGNGVVPQVAARAFLTLSRRIGER